MWRNWIARQTSNLKVAGSNPAIDRSVGFIVKLVITVDFESTISGSSPDETFSKIPYSLVVRITGFHPVDPGSIPGVGSIFLKYCVC